jgi:hypothetical protein
MLSKDPIALFTPGSQPRNALAAFSCLQRKKVQKRGFKEVISSFSASGVKTAISRHMVKSLLKTLGVITLAALVAGAYVYWPTVTAFAQTGKFQTSQAVAAAKAPDTTPAPGVMPANVQFAPAITLDLPAAIDQELIQAEFRGNGREKMHVAFTNKGTQHIRLHVPAGLIFQNGTSSMVLLKAHDFDLKSGELKEDDVQSAATSASNQVVDAPFSLTVQSEPKLFPLLTYLDKHPEVAQNAVQTAVLALTENLPVSAFAKFAQAGGEAPSKYDNSAFKVETSDIILALSVLHEIGIPDDQLALTIDPQLKIEAMIDPLAHALAMRYYGITQENEWAYWKHHLLEGEESTRHYALYGIARFYPDIALQMLPTWVRQADTNPVYRISAVQALAETQRPEAVTILRQLEHEFGMLTEIGKAAHNAANVLDARLSKTTESKIAFRAGQNVPQLALQ